VLVVAIAYQLAVLTWRVVPGATTQGSLPTTIVTDSSATVTQRSLDFGDLTQSHLFGEAPVEAAPSTQTVVDAPDTTLSLRLTGIIYGEGGIPSQAIIGSNSDQEKTYQIGHALDGANGATLHAVYGDRVILNRNGRLETLRQPQELSRAGPTLPPRPLAAAPTPEQSGSLRQVISANASRLADIMRIQPHVEEGQVVGFRINPGRNREAFETLGLQAGDVVTDINGTVLDDPSRGLQVFEALGEATMANVTVLRNGVPQLIVIDTSQLQSLQENRE
ncbi:MAG TPA: type II secretion system protein GspC, partial [Gammaproteobacteria bacterium]|nr:type II secretion system protein GspC [Gammaproteobacteria bacterium]